MHPKALLEACTELVKQVLKFDHPADAVVSRYFREHRNLGPRERATLAETAYTVLRQLRRFDHLARSGPGARERKLAALGFHGDRAFLGSALNEAERQWLEAVNRLTDADLQEPHRHNLPDWMVEPLRSQVGAAFGALTQALNEPAPLDLRVNDLKQKRPAAIDGLKGFAITAEVTPYSPWGIRVQGKPAIQKLAAFQDGELEVQDEGSQLLAWLLEAKRGEMVTDFCAGAGGKTLALGAMMRSTGRLYAFDVSAHRLDALKPRLARSGLSNVHPVAIAHERDERVKRLAGKMDRVLVDAPCSGLGTLRRNPDLKWRQTPGAIAELQQKQNAILASASRLVKPGGRLVYATCSLLQAENEDVAQAFTASHPEFEPLSVRDVLARLLVQQAPKGEDPAEWAAAQAASLTHSDYLRLWPHLHQTDGFFAAAWVRRN